MSKAVAASDLGFSGREFLAYLERHNLTDANAARVFGVAESTIKYCCRNGISGFGARFVETLIRLEISPQELAVRINMPLTSIPRSKATLRGGRRGGNMKQRTAPALVMYYEMVRAYIIEESAATIGDIERYFALKAIGDVAAKDVILAMADEGMLVENSGVYKMPNRIEITPSVFEQREPRPVPATVAAERHGLSASVENSALVIKPATAPPLDIVPDAPQLPVETLPVEAPPRRQFPFKPPGKKG